MPSLSGQGLVIDSYQEILTRLQRLEQELINPDIELSDDKLLGQFNQIISNSMSELQELIQYVYSSFILTSAEGKQLDDLAALRGVTRLRESYTGGLQLFTGENGRTIPAGSIVKNPVTNDTFYVTTPLRLTPNAARRVIYEVSDVFNSTLYELKINERTYSYTSDATATRNEILNGILSLYTTTPAVDTTMIRVGDTLVIDTTSLVDLNTYSVTYLKPVSISMHVYVIATVSGGIITPSNSVTQLVTPITGVDSTTNVAQFTIGRDRETDEELRLRIPQVTSSGATGTPDSIRGAILSNVAGVISVLVEENDTNVTDADNRPPKSYEVVVVGGTDEDVAKEVWRTKGAGIRVVGNTSYIVNDSNDRPRLVRFTRPVVVPLAFRVQYEIYDEELFPVNGDDMIRQIMVDQTKELGVGRDVIPQRYFGKIYEAVSGIEKLIISVQEISASGVTPNPLNWQTELLAISTAEFANCELIDVTTSEVS